MGNTTSEFEAPFAATFCVPALFDTRDRFGVGPGRPLAPAVCIIPLLARA